MQRVFQTTFNIAGALSANHVFTFKAPFDMQLIHVSMSNSSANAGTLDIGLAADADGWKDGATFGVSGACTELAAFSDFDGDTGLSQFPHCSDGDVIHVTIKDHASHMADPCVALTFTEG